MTFEDDNCGPLRFYIPGKPVPQGSKRWLPGGRMIEANSALRPWRATVTMYARQAMEATKSHLFPFDRPLTVTMDFTFARPKSHYGTGKNAGIVKKNAPQYVPSVPDLDKLVRAVNDGIGDAGLWLDDSQVVNLHASKVYAQQPGVTVEVWAL